MKNVMGLLLLSVLSASCVNLSGNLNVSETLTAKKRGGFLNLQLKTVKIEPGNYSSNLKINSDKSFTLKLRAEKEGDADILIPIKSEKSFNLPTTGAVEIKGSEVAQPFDIKGSIVTNVTSSEQVRTTESCTYTLPEQRCEKVCVETPNPAPRVPREGERRPVDKAVDCRVVCQMVQVSYNGNRFVEYHTLYTSRSLTANIHEVDSAKVLATFSGNGNESDRINDYVGECR